jgi:prevent-host-death family protein
MMTDRNGHQSGGLIFEAAGFASRTPQFQRVKYTESLNRGSFRSDTVYPGAAWTLTEGRMEKEQESMAISEFKATCLKVLERVKQTGNSVLVTKRGDAIALIMPPPLPPKRVSWLGMYKDEGKINGNLVDPVVDESDWEVLAE